MKAGLVIAIDGPAGSGKSTTARLVAQRLGLFHLDTGAMYRAVTLKIITSGIDIRNRQALERLLKRTKVELRGTKKGTRVYLDGKDVTEAIRKPEVSERVSEVSAIGCVRAAMVKEQRRLAKGKNVVCEGRDIGSVVFPFAQLKVFLDCALEERARRRQKELAGAAQGSPPSIEQVRRNLAKRDFIDSRRRLSPLHRVREAVLVDTTHLTIEEQVGVVCSLAKPLLK